MAVRVPGRALLARGRRRRGLRWGAVLGLGLVLGLAPSRHVAALGWPSEVVRIGVELSSQDTSERARAAVRLASLPAGSARALVELALEDEDDAVRLAAARAATAHGLLGLGDQVSGWLKEPSADLRAAALRILAVDLEARHIPSVARAALDPDERVRTSAVRCLGRARQAQASEVIPTLATALDDASPLVRIEAAVGLGRVGDGAAVSALVARLTDAEEGVRRAAAVALGAVGDHRATAALSYALEDRSVGVAALAARGLGELRDASALPALERALRKPGWGPLQIASAQALAALDLRAGWDAIAIRLSEQDAAPMVRGLFANPTPAAKETIAACLLESGGLGLLECARIASQARMSLDGLLGRVRRGGLPTAKLFQVAAPTRDVELLVLAIERLVRGTAAERHAALELLDQSAPLPPQTGALLGEALTVPGLGARDVARLLLLLEPDDVDDAVLLQLTRASDDLVAASARALRALEPAPTASVLEPFAASPVEASVYGRLLSRGMDRAFAVRLMRELSESREPLSKVGLQALAGVPRDLPAETVEQLARLLSAEQGESRDAILPILATQRAVGAHLATFFAQGSVLDRRSLAAMWPHLPPQAALIRTGLSDPDPWVRAQAAQAASVSEVGRLLELARADQPAFVRAAALQGLAAVAAERAADTLRVCDLLQAPELGVRVGALRVLDLAGADCPHRPLGDILLSDREPVLRELAARALVRREPDHRALRSCRAYDPEPAVAAACAPRQPPPAGLPEAELEFVEVVPPWLDDPAPSCPYALLDATGRAFIGVTDRRGRAPLPGAGKARLLDPRVAL